MTKKQICGMVLIFGSTIVGMPLQSARWIFLCGLVSLSGLLLVVKGSKGRVN